MREKLLLIAVLTLASQAVMGESPRPLPAKTTSIEAPFDLKQSQIAPGFHGNDAPAIFRRLLLQNKQLQKSEFETTAQFETRASAAREKPIIGKVTRQSVLSYVCGTCTTSTFDADQKSLVVFVDKAFGGYDDDTLIISKKYTHRGSYMASNAFGGRIQVARFEQYAFQLRALPYSIFPLKPRFVLPMSTQEARAIKPRIKTIILYILDPEDPASASEDSHEVTFDYPFEGIHHTYSLNVKVVDIWLLFKC